MISFCLFIIVNFYV